MRHSAPNSLHARDIAALIHPGTHLRKHLTTGPMVITGGKGNEVFDDDGKSYFDASAGLWCASLGFGNERLAQVAYDAIRNIGFYHIFRHMSSETAIELAERLLAMAPVPMSKVFFQCSGSEANDTAIKLSWYYWNAVGQPQRRKMIAQRDAYHGSGTASVSLTGKAEFHAAFGLPLPGFLHTDFPHYYRAALPGETEDEFTTRSAESLERLIVSEGPETIAAFFAEPVMGGGGAVLPPTGYFDKIQAVLRKYEILFVADEVICGFGRTGNMWGSQTYNLKPDIVTCAKALSAAMQPISAVLLNEKIFQAMLTQSDRIGSFYHGYTYAGHPVTTAVALEVLKIYEEMDIVGRVRSVSPTFLSAFDALRDHPIVGDVRGCGLILGVDVVEDKNTRAMFAPERGVMAKIDQNARKHGLILRLVKNRVVFSPPLVATKEELLEMVRRFKASLDDTVDELASE